MRIHRVIGRFGLLAWGLKGLCGYGNETHAPAWRNGLWVGDLGLPAAKTHGGALLASGFESQRL